MNEIDKTWLHERGLLHDARIVAVRHTAHSLEIDIDDEWANERGLARTKDEKNPTILCFDNAVVIGMLSDSGWISGIELDDEGNFQLSFCDRDPVKVCASSGTFRPFVGQ